MFALGFAKEHVMTWVQCAKLFCDYNKQSNHMWNVIQTQDMKNISHCKRITPWLEEQYFDALLHLLTLTVLVATIDALRHFETG